MPVLNKFRIRTPLDEFENILGEEMNAFSELFWENNAEETNVELAPEPPVLDVGKKELEKNPLWLRRVKHFFFKISSDLFS